MASGQSTEIIEKRGSCAFLCLINMPQNFLYVGTPFTSCLADPRASSVIFCLSTLDITQQEVPGLSCHTRGSVPGGNPGDL